MYYGASRDIMNRARELRDNMTLEENLVWQFLRKNQLGVKFRRQHPINSYIADFYCHRAKLVIEIDGVNHRSKEHMIYDKNRDAVMSDFGISIIRITNQECNENMSEVMRRIEARLYKLLPDLADGCH